MLKKNNFFRFHLSVAILFIISVATHLQWFNPFSILNSSDWGYWSNEVVEQLYNSYGSWISFFNFGTVNIQLPFSLFTSIWSLITNSGFSYDLATKVTFLIPIAILGFISPYILFKKLIKNELASFVAALFYGTTTHFLVRQTSHLPIAFVYALTPLIIYFFIRALEKNRLANWLIFVLLYWISGCYEIRITYVVSFLLFLYFLYFHVFDIKKYWKNILISILLFISLSIFWLLPTILSGFSSDISVIADRGLFGNFLFDLRNAFVISESSWTGDLLNNQFIKQPIIWYLWIIPIIAFSSFLFRDNKRKREIIFFSLVSLIGIFLTKQSAEPLTGAYLWLYNNFPGFNLFREASKFYLLTAIGYTGLIGYGLLSLKEHKHEILNKHIFLSFSIILIAVSFWNIKPLVTGEIRTMFIPKHIPHDYIILKDLMLNQSEYFRTMYVPRDSRWGFFVNTNPKINSVSVIGDEWKNLLENYNKNEKVIQNRIINVFEIPFANNLANISSIKYVIVPIQDIANDDDFFMSYGGRDDPNIRDWYISELDKIKFLKKIDIGTKELVVYENENFRPHIYLTEGTETIHEEVPFKKVDFEQKNPTEYDIHLKNISRTVNLNFSESFHPDWKLRAGDFNWFAVLTDKYYFLSDKFHRKNDANLNSFNIDPEYLKRNYPEAVSENSDGTINVEMTLYFKPQSYFYLGLIISITTLIGCLGYLIFDFFKRKKENEAKNKPLI